jgi:RNA polymerase sigma-70 factor (ECF subfamily)
VRAELLRRLGRLDEAAQAFATAAGLTENAAERASLDRRRRALTDASGP